jgi:hypothetical protein
MSEYCTTYVDRFTAWSLGIEPFSTAAFLRLGSTVCSKKSWEDFYECAATQGKLQISRNLVSFWTPDDILLPIDKSSWGQFKHQ